jgi:glycosyltransferase involved in cell wall biosynthesis
MRHQRVLVQNADAVFLQTRREAEFYRNGTNTRKFIRLGPGVDPEELRGGDASRARARFQLEGPVVLFLGTLSTDKGALTLVKAMEQLWTKVDASPLLVLAGQVLDEFSEQFQKVSSPTRSRTRLLGSIPDDDKNDLLAACDLLALPSRADSFGIVLLEAWLYGKPVIGAKAGGIPDVIEDGRDGFLVNFGDAETLAARIQQLLNDRELAQAFGATGRAKVLAQHTWDQKYAVMREVYRRVAAREPLDEMAEA